MSLRHPVQRIELSISQISQEIFEIYSKVRSLQRIELSMLFWDILNSQITTENFSQSQLHILWARCACVCVREYVCEYMCEYVCVYVYVCVCVYLCVRVRDFCRFLPERYCPCRIRVRLNLWNWRGGAVPVQKS